MYPDIDMIILDIMMPRLDGISVVHEVRKENAQLPILLLSAKSTDIDKIQGLTNGADDYVTKPFNPLEVNCACEIIITPFNDYARRPS